MRIKRFFQKIFNWERWPFFILYAPLAPMWAWYCLRSGSWWFFSSSNPTLTFGGFEGESKKEMYDQLPPDTVPKTIYIVHDLPFDEVKKKVCEAGFTYPFVVKPDVGMRGILFRKINKEEQFKKYHENIPVEYIVQELVEFPLEISVFYYRYPDQQQGHITGFIQKNLMTVTGDGKSTLMELILRHPRAKFRLKEMKRRHEHRLDRVLAEGENFYLSYAGNHFRGASFIDLTEQIDHKLLTVFDRLSHYTDKFYYGRYDIKCNSVEELKEGKNFSILEFNGSGSEPIHVYDADLSLFGAYRVILKHWRILYHISKHNHRNGVPYWSFNKGRKFLRDAKRHFRMLSKYD